MGAVVVDSSLTAANWTKTKPKDYKSADLDKALKDWEALAGKKVTQPDFPSKLSIADYEACIKDSQAMVKHLKECDAALAKLIAAAVKAGTELKKLGDKKDGDEKKQYLNAASSAAAIGGTAKSAKGKLA